MAKVKLNVTLKLEVEEDINYFMSLTDNERVEAITEMLMEPLDTDLIEILSHEYIVEDTTDACS